MSEAFPVLFIFSLSTLNTVSSLLYYSHQSFPSPVLQHCFLLSLCAQPLALYLSYLRTAWISLQDCLFESTPDAVVVQALALAGYLPVYVVLGVLKLLPLSLAFLYLAPHRTTSQQWTKEAGHYPILYQGLLQSLPCLIVSILNDFDPTDPLTLLFAWSAVAMLTVSLLSLRQVLRRLPRRDV